MKFSQGALLPVAAVLLLPVEASGSPMPFDLQQSAMTVYVAKQGVFSFLADNHQIAAPIASGSYDASGNSVVVTVDPARLAVLDPKLPTGRRAQVQDAMETQVLEVARYPTIAFRSTAIQAAGAGRLTVTGDLTLHGETHPIRLDVAQSDATHFSGTATVRQTEFGIRPIRIAGGSVSVKDDVRIEFHVVLTRRNPPEDGGVGDGAAGPRR